MLCCGAKQKGGNNYTYAIQRKNLKTRIKKAGHDLKLKDEVIEELTEKFDQYATDKYGIKVQQEADFKEMTGALGNFFIGERMFAVALRVSRETEQRVMDQESEESEQSDQDKAYLKRPGAQRP